jgi:hypothetical protein
MNSGTVIVNSLDSRCSVLESEGYVVVGESWGAHLMFHVNSDLAVYQQRIDSLELRGFELRELTQESAYQVLELELKTNAAIRTPRQRLTNYPRENRFWNYGNPVLGFSARSVNPSWLVF